MAERSPMPLRRKAPMAPILDKISPQISPWQGRRLRPGATRTRPSLATAGDWEPPSPGPISLLCVLRLDLGVTDHVRPFFAFGVDAPGKNRPVTWPRPRTQLVAPLLHIGQGRQGGRS